MQDDQTQEINSGKAVINRVLLVTGSAPPDACGVGDYTQSLAAALEKAGLQVSLFCHRDWSMFGTSWAIRKLLAAKDSLVHIQYPTMGYGHSLGPQFCALVKPSVVTIHEFSLAHPLRKLSLLPFTMRSLCLMTPSEFERRLLLRKMPWIGHRIRVIPIGSNILPPQTPSENRQESITYFGLIMPRKGLEDFIELSRLVREKGLNWDLLVVGRIAPGQAVYAKSLFERSHTLRIRWILDQSAEDVSTLLSRAGIGYLPFPDGASERRGSLKAALAAGLPCITTRTEQTPQELSDAVMFAATPAKALESALRLMTNGTERQRLSRVAFEYSQQFTWEKIAESHLQIYQELYATRLGN